VPDNEEFIGEVTKRPFGAGSKSEHLAVYLETGDGNFVLRRPGGNPFSDPALEGLVGKRIRCWGARTDYLLILSKWTLADGAC
jgi:hypothetical protein